MSNDPTLLAAQDILLTVARLAEAYHLFQSREEVPVTELRALEGDMEQLLTLDPSQVRALAAQPDGRLTIGLRLPAQEGAEAAGVEMARLCSERDKYRNLVEVLHSEAAQHDRARYITLGFSGHVVRRIESQLLLEGLPPALNPEGAGWVAAPASDLPQAELRPRGREGGGA